MNASKVRFRKHRAMGAQTIGAAIAILAAGVTSCSTGGEPATDTVQLQLDFGGGVTLTSVNYQLTGPGGFRQLGTLSVGDQPTVSATFQNLPVGMGYDIQVKGTANDNSDACKGEVMFDVTSSMTAVLQIPLTCTGLASINTIIDVCPVIDSLSAVPSEVYVGNSIQVVAQVHDADNGPMPLTATWQTTGGTLSNLSTTGATFTCTAPGTYTIGLKISDGGGMTSCPDKAMLTLTCTAPSAELAPVRPLRRRAV
jgi:hypothetical protein